MKSGILLSAALLVVGFQSKTLQAQNAASAPAGKVTTSTSQSALNQIQPNDVTTGRATSTPASRPGNVPNFPPTPTPKPPVKPMTPEELDAHVVPSKALSETSNVVALAYSGYRRSQIDPCGCVTHQLGGIDKEAGLLRRLEELNIPTVRVDAGGFLRDMPTDRDIDRSRGLLRVLGELKVDAVNVSFADLGAGVDKLKEMAGPANVKLISANVVDGAGKPIFEPYVVKEVSTPKGEKVRVGIVGITRPRVPVNKTTATVAVTNTPTPAPGNASFTVQDPTEVLNKIVPEIRGKADVVIALLYDRRDKAANTLEGLAENAKVDVVVTSEWLTPNANILKVGDTRVVTAGFEGRQMGLLTMGFEQAKLSSAHNQFIEVLQSIPTVPAITKLMEEVKGANGAKPAAPTATPAKLEL